MACGEPAGLIRKGTYQRQMVDENGKGTEVKIQRARCHVCNASFSFLYDFLVPHSKFSVKALAAVVENYLVEPNSYLSALSSGVAEAATLFRAIEYFLSNLPSVWMWLSRVLIAQGVTVDELSKTMACPNGRKCRKPKKEEKLHWARSLVQLVPKIFEQTGEYGISLFSISKRVVRCKGHT